MLDIDGVMVPANSWRRPEFHEDGFPVFSDKAVNALNRIITETNAKVILTTSHKSKYSIAKWKAIFNHRGVQIRGIEKLSNSKIMYDRKDEIVTWFNKRKDSDVEEFVIIDDDKMLNGLPGFIKENLVLTSPSIGLTDELAQDAIDKLKHHKVGGGKF